MDKDAEARLPADTPLADRITMVYLGTAVVAGSGVALVTATGLATELWRIGQLVALAGLQWLTVSWGPLQALLGTVPLSGGDWLAVVCAVLWPVLGSPRPTSEAVTRDSGYEMP